MGDSGAPEMSVGLFLGSRGEQAVWCGSWHKGGVLGDGALEVRISAKTPVHVSGRGRTWVSFSSLGRHKFGESLIEAKLESEQGH